MQISFLLKLLGACPPKAENITKSGTPFLFPGRALCCSHFTSDVSR